MGYRKFWEDSNHVVTNSFTPHLTHKPGIKFEDDWRVATISIVSRDIGEIVTV